MGLVILLHDLSVFVRIVLEPAVLTTQRFPSNRFSQYFLQNQNGRQCGAVKKIRLVSWRQRRSKRMNNSLVLLIFERRIKWKFLFNRIPTTVPLPNLMNHGTCQNWQLLQTAKRGWTQLWSSVVKVMTLVPFQPIGISPFWRKGKFSFFQKSVQSLYFSHSSVPPIPSLPFCAGLQFSRDSIHSFNDRTKILENRALWTV